MSALLPMDAKSQATRKGDVNVWPVLPADAQWWPRRDMPRKVYRNLSAHIRRAERDCDETICLSYAAAAYLGLDSDDPTAPGDVDWFDTDEVLERLSGFAPLMVLDWIGVSR